MAKKASLLRKAKKYGLDVTEANTVPQITEAIAKFEKENPPSAEPVQNTGETTPPEAPETPQNDEVGAVPSVELDVPESENYTLKQVLLVYNSINKSRRRWVINRNNLRNTWKELFELLERASGRDGGKAGVFDPNWHEVVDKGAVSGAADRAPEDVQVTINEVDPARVAELEAEVQDLKSQLQAALEAKEIAENGTTGGEGDEESNEQA